MFLGGDKGMVYQVLIVDTVLGDKDAHKPDLVKEFEGKGNAFDCAMEEAKKYCQGNEKPHACKYDSQDKILVLTPTDFAVLVRKVDKNLTEEDAVAEIELLRKKDFQDQADMLFDKYFAEDGIYNK